VEQAKKKDAESQLLQVRTTILVCHGASLEIDSLADSFDESILFVSGRVTGSENRIFLVKLDCKKSANSRPGHLNLTFPLERRVRAFLCKILPTPMRPTV
jgi:hypothetical protein